MASEDHNIPLEARIELLEKIKIQLGHLKVLPEFWAVCQFADLERLRDLCKVDRAGLEIFQYNAAQITAQWSRSTRRDQLYKYLDLSDVESLRKLFGIEPIRDDSMIERSYVAEEQCKLRDGDRCVLSYMPYQRSARTVPFPIAGRTKEEKDNLCAPFLVSASLFWTDEHIQKWKQSMSTDPDSGVPIDSCDNMISLGPRTHFLWIQGIFALKPVRLSDDERELEMQFFWQPDHRHPETVELSLMPLSSENLTRSGELDWQGGEAARLLRSGDRLILRTDDPSDRPLPNWHLLEMQWIFQRIVGMSGTAKWKYIKGDFESNINGEFGDEDDHELVLETLLVPLRVLNSRYD